MAYGRLDVFWPDDGMFRTFPLVENTVSVGRSTGNTIALETTTISRYHFSINHNGDEVTITDLESVNGTFVDSEKLKANQPRRLDGGEEIQAGHLRMIYHRLDEQPTQPMAAVDDTTQRIELELPDFRIDVIGPDQPFSPGAHMTAEIGITNTSDKNQRYRVEVTGMPAEWIRIDRPELSIDAGEMGQVSANFKPLRRPDSKPGDYTVLIRVSLKDDPDEKLEASLTIRILPYAGFGVALDSPRLNSGERFRLHLHNQGSAPLPIMVNGREKSDNLRFNLSASQMTLAPGQRVTVQGEVKPKNSRFFGKPKQYPFDLMVRSKDAAHFIAAVRGYFTEKPALPSWMPFVLGAGAILVTIAFIIVAVLVFQPQPTPTIASFQVSSTQVAQGTPIVVNWAATDVSQFTLRLNGTPVLTDINGDTPGVSLDTQGLSGNVIISLQAVNGGQQTIASQTVNVYRPVGAFVFTAEPTQLVRYVVQDLSVSWSVTGAVTTRITGLENFSNTPTDATFGPDGTLTGLVGIPADALTLTLYAQDEAGNLSQQTLEIPVINPECVPSGASATLYGGPDTRHQVVSTVGSGAFVVVDAQDSGGTWLRVQLPGGLHGWGRTSDFTCAQNFSVADLVKEVNLPTVPPPTNAPTLTVTPTRTPPPPTRTPRPNIQAVGTSTPSG